MKYLKCCVDFKRSEVPNLDKMIDEASNITYKTFIKHVGRKKTSLLFPFYNWGRKKEGTIKLKDDWAVSFHKSKLKGVLVYYIRHSAIEYIFI